jgi:hypothetical protein
LPSLTNRFSAVFVCGWSDDIANRLGHLIDLCHEFALSCEGELEVIESPCFRVPKPLPVRMYSTADMVKGVGRVSRAQWQVNGQVRAATFFWQSARPEHQFRFGLTLEPANANLQWDSEFFAEFQRTFESTLEMFRWEGAALAPLDKIKLDDFENELSVLVAGYLTFLGVEVPATFDLGFGLWQGRRVANGTLLEVLPSAETRMNGPADFPAALISKPRLLPKVLRQNLPMKATSALEHLSDEEWRHDWFGE